MQEVLAFSFLLLVVFVADTTAPQLHLSPMVGAKVKSPAEFDAAVGALQSSYAKLATANSSLTAQLKSATAEGATNKAKILSIQKLL